MTSSLSHTFKQKNRQTLFQFTFTLSILISSNFPHKYSLLMLSCISCVFGLRADVSKFPILEKEGNWGELTFAKTSGTVTRDNEKIDQ